MKNTPKLSICIPTYNRANLLDNTLSRIKREVCFDFPYEIIISNNASADNTGEIVSKYEELGLPVRISTLKSTVSMHQNVSNAYRLAAGTYLMYLSDDDFFYPERVSEAVALLDENPNSAACYTPWELYDESNNTIASCTKQFEKTEIIDKNNFIRLFEAITKTNMMLELGIYRSSSILPLVMPFRFCFFPDVMAAHLLRYGDLILLEKPYYQYILNPSAGRSQVTAGTLIAKHGWDLRVGGSEYFFYYGLQTTGVQLTEKQKVTVAFLIGVSRVQRMLTALSIMIKLNDHLEAYYLYARAKASLCILQPHDKICLNQDDESMPTLIKVKDFIQRITKELDSYKPDKTIATLQAAVEMINSSTTSDLILFGFTDPETLLSHLIHYGLLPRMKAYVISDDALDLIKQDTNSLIITADSTHSKLLINAGYSHGRIINLNELSNILVT